MLENPVYTGRLYWNRLDFRAAKQGEGPLVRRSAEEWVEAERRHEALISDEDFERVRAEMKVRSTGNSGNRRRYKQNRFYLLRGVVHCATGHNPLRMHGKSRKGNTYYTCGYRRSYGDTAAEATGHGKWQYVREDNLVDLVDAFFATRVFGADRVDHFRRQASTLATAVENEDGGKRERANRQLADVEHRIERQLAAIEAGVDPVLVGERIRALKSEREEVEALVAQLEQSSRNGGGIGVEDAAAILDSLPDLSKALKMADPEQRRAVFEAFRLRVEIDRNVQQIRLKALVSSAFSQVRNLSELCATKAIAGAGFEPATFGL